MRRWSVGNNPSITSFCYRHPPLTCSTARWVFPSTARKAGSLKSSIPLLPSRLSLLPACPIVKLCWLLSSHFPYPRSDATRTTFVVLPQRSSLRLSFSLKHLGLPISSALLLVLNEIPHTIFFLLKLRKKTKSSSALL